MNPKSPLIVGGLVVSFLAGTAFGYGAANTFRGTAKPAANGPAAANGTDAATIAASLLGTNTESKMLNGVITTVSGSTITVQATVAAGNVSSFVVLTDETTRIVRREPKPEAQFEKESSDYAAAASAWENRQAANPEDAGAQPVMPQPYVETALDASALAPGVTVQITAEQNIVVGERIAAAVIEVTGAAPAAEAEKPLPTAASDEE